MIDPRSVSDVSLDQIRTFVALADAGSMPVLVERSGRSRAAIWQQLYRLQRSLDATGGENSSRPLFDPVTGRLTQDGRALLDQARGLVAAASAWASTVRSALGRPNVLRAGGYPAHIELLAALRPGPADEGASVLAADTAVTDASRSAEGDGLLSALIDGSLDVVIAPRASTPESNTDRTNNTLFDRMPLYDWSFVVAAPRNGKWLRGVKGNAIDVEALAGAPLLASPRGHRSRELLEKAGVEIAAENASADALLAMAAAGLGAALMPADALPIRHVDGWTGPSVPRTTTVRNHWPLLEVRGKLLGDGYDAVCLKSRVTEGAVMNARNELHDAAARLMTSAGLTPY